MIYSHQCILEMFCLKVLGVDPSLLTHSQKVDIEKTYSFQAFKLGFAFKSLASEILKAIPFIWKFASEVDGIGKLISKKKEDTMFGLASARKVRDLEWKLRKLAARVHQLEQENSHIQAGHTYNHPDGSAIFFTEDKLSTRETLDLLLRHLRLEVKCHPARPLRFCIGKARSKAKKNDKAQVQSMTFKWTPANSAANTESEVPF